MFPGALLALTVAVAGQADVVKPKKLLLVTHSGGFIHDSVGVAEDVMKKFGPSKGYEVTAWRYTADTNDPRFGKYQEDFRKRTGKPVEPANCGRLNKETLKNFDVVFFFTTGSGPTKKNIAPLTPEELADLQAWVKAGGAFVGTHCASDTLYDSSYGAFVGGYFKTHPPGLHNIKVKVEDKQHPAAAGFTDGMAYKDEIYIFTDEPYSRDKLHIILSCERGSFKEAENPKVARADGDYALAWCKEEGKGKVFYTAFGHRKEVWQDEPFQAHLFGGIDWAVGRKPGDAAPTGKK